MVKVAIMSIGDELMNGTTLDSNSSWISKKISEYSNLKVVSKITVLDDRCDINSNLADILDEDCEYLFITGGLGPTHDDITKDALKVFFNSKLVIYKPHYIKVKKYLKNKNYINISDIENQSKILDISTPIDNDIGLALGMAIKLKNIIIFVVAGVHREVKKMVANKIIPKYIDPFFVKNIKYLTVLTTGAYENKLFRILDRIIDANKNDYQVSFLPNYAGVKIRLYNIKNNIDGFLEFRDFIVSKIDKYVYGFDDDLMESIVIQLLNDRKKTLAVAESCTGGLISKKITDVNGSSFSYKGGVIAYSNSVKINDLNVSQSTINKYGAVSEDVALEMAIGIRKKIGADIGIATTGISGPSGGSKRKPVGLIYIAISTKNKNFCKKFNLIQDRELHRIVATQTALNMLRLHLK